MPIFEYHCSDCDREFEAYVSAERTAECPACQGTNLVKRLSSPGMVGASAGRHSSPAPMAGGCGPAARTARAGPGVEGYSR